MMYPKFFKKATAWTMLFALVLSYVYTGSFPFHVPKTNAAINAVISTEGLPNYLMNDRPIRVSSVKTPVMRIQIGNSEADDHLSTTTINFDTSTSTNFQISDLFDLLANITSGVALYQDNGSSTGYFDSLDSMLSLNEPPSYSASTTASSTAVTFAGDNFALSSSTLLATGATTTFFVVIKTSSTCVNGDRIIASIQPGDILTASSGQAFLSSFQANSYIVDTRPPYILSVNLNTNNSVYVTFNEKIQTSAANMSYYTFFAAQAIGASMINDYTVKVDAPSAITPGTTLFFANPSILDLAGLANASTSAITITSASPKILFSEISVDYIDSGGDTEFIELYNTGDTAVNMYGWRIQYSSSSVDSWTDIAYIDSACYLANTTINPHSYYLIGGPSLNNVVSGYGKDCNFTNYNNDIFQAIGGHLRLLSYPSQEIDRIGWGTAIYPEGSSTPAHAPEQSWERKAYSSATAASMASGGLDELKGNSYDSNSNYNDFVIQPYPDPQNASSTPENNSGEDTGLGIEHTSVNSAPLNTALNIFARMGSQTLSPDQINAELHFMINDGNRYDNATSSYTTTYGVHQGNGYFKFTIPAASTTAAGLLYYLKVSSGSTTRLMSASPTADFSNNEASVAINPFTISCYNPGSTYYVSGNVTLSGTSDYSDVLIVAEGSGYFATTTSSGYFNFLVKSGTTYNFALIKNGYLDASFDNIYIYQSRYLGAKTLYPGTGGGSSGNLVKPYVKWTGPGNYSTGMPYYDPSFKIKVSFSKDLASSTFNTNNVMLAMYGTSTVSGYSVEYNPERTAYMPSTSTDPYLGIINVPSGGLNPGTTYYVILTDNVRDSSNNSIISNRTEGGYAFSFTTQGLIASSTYGTGANYPPYVSDVKPSPGSISAATNTKITLTFSEPMYSGSINSTNIKLRRIIYSDYSESSTTVPFSWVMDTTGKIVILTPAEALLTNAKYRVTLTGALKSAAGIYMGNSLTGQNTSYYEVYNSSFETGNSGDTSAPTVTASWPVNDAAYISVNPGSFNFQFNESLNPTRINANNVSLKQGSTLVNTEIKYDSLANAIYIMPLNVLSASTTYTITLTGSSTGITDTFGNAMASDHIVNFTTANYDDQPPRIMYVSANEYKLAITFSEPMNAGNMADSYNWTKSVLNPNNYIVKWGDPSTVATGGNVLDLAGIGTQFYYDNYTNTVFLENLGLDSATTTGMDIYIDMDDPGLASDLSGNAVASSSNKVFQTPINNSAVTGSDLGPNTNGTATYDMGTMGMMKAGAWPKNSLAGLSTTYFIDIPTTRQIPADGKIMITFPMGFSLGSAIMDPDSAINDDLNGDNSGVIGVSSITANEAGRYITITLDAATQDHDYLHMDIAEIINTAIPRGHDTSGYTVDIKTLDQNGVLLESITAMPFFITPAGNNSLTINILGIADADVSGDEEMKVYIGSPLTGPMDQIVAIANNGSGNAVFSGLPSGNYYIFTDPSINFPDNGGSQYAGISSPEPYYLAASSSKDITLAKEAAGLGKAAINIDISGTFGTEYADIFASGPNGYKVKTVTGAGLSPTATFYLADGNWMIGVVPHVPFGETSGSSKMPDWMPPMPVQVTIASSGSIKIENNGIANDGTIAFNIQSASKEIIGYVKDDTGSSTADAEVWAYQPGGTSGMGAHTRTDTNGKFVLKLYQAGSYKIGAYKPGMPKAPERAATVAVNASNDDGNTTADVYDEAGTLITETEAEKFIIKIKRPGYTISGKITDGTNQVASTPVWAKQLNGYGYANTMSDSTGNFILYVENGTWELNGSIPNYGNAEAKTIVVNGANVSQNLAPNSSQSYRTITGVVGIDTNGTYSSVETPLAYQPIRAVAYSAQGIYQGHEYNTITNSTGFYRLTVPAGIYRVDIWTQQYGEIGVNNQDQDNTLNEASDDDKYANNPANVNLTSSNTLNADIIIVEGNLRNITLGFTNGTASQEGYIKIEGITNTNPPVPTGYNNFMRVSDLSASASVRLSDGFYIFSLDVPGLGRFKPASSSIEVSADRTVNFTLPVIGTDTFTVSGTITDGTNPLPGAWVWIKNPDTGYNFGTSSNASGNYSLNMPIGNNYKIGADKLGYIGTSSAGLNISTTTTGINFILTAAAQTISGYIYNDLDSDNAKDDGEEIANGFVRAETTDGTKKSQAPVNGAGYFSLPVVNGVWKIYGMADGYEETYYGTSTANNPYVYIKLNANENWTNRAKSSSIIPANGGTIDDTAASGTLIRLTFPPNALGNSSSAGNVNANRTTAVAETNSSQIVGNAGVNVTAADNNGRAITNLNDYIDVEMLLYKSDVEAASSTLTNEQLKNASLSYWDSSANDWLNLSTTRTAYYKSSADDTEWTLYANAATTTELFSAFINEIAAGSLTTVDYKLSFTAKSNHLTIFAVIMPYLSTPAEAAPETPAPETPAPGGGSGGSSVTYCSTVTYDQWGACVSGWRYRNVLTRTPNSCTLTAGQEGARKEACELALIEEIPEVTTVSETSPAVVGELYYNEGEIAYRAEINEIMAASGVTVRNHLGEKLSRETLINKLGIKLNTLPLAQQYALANFITYGTPATVWLGWRERAGVLNSYKAAFGRIPFSAADWQDLIKIGNGRWPKEKSTAAENNAKTIFKKIYKREANMKNANDNAAVTVISYGLRPAKRNFNSEKAAIIIFKGIFKYNPSGATDWDAVRAIAYSGSKR